MRNCPLLSDTPRAKSLLSRIAGSYGGVVHSSSGAAAELAEREVADHQDGDSDHDVFDVRPRDDAPHHRAEQRAEPGPEAPVDDAGGEHAPGELHERDLRGPTDERHGDPEARNEP